jgi:hypothetical protein
MAAEVVPIAVAPPVAVAPTAQDRAAITVLPPAAPTAAMKAAGMKVADTKAVVMKDEVTGPDAAAILVALVQTAPRQAAALLPKATRTSPEPSAMDSGTLLATPRIPAPRLRLAALPAAHGTPSVRLDPSSAAAYVPVSDSDAAGVATDGTAVGAGVDGVGAGPTGPSTGAPGTGTPGSITRTGMHLGRCTTRTTTATATTMETMTFVLPTAIPMPAPRRNRRTRQHRRRTVSPPIPPRVQVPERLA